MAGNAKAGKNKEVAKHGGIATGSAPETFGGAPPKIPITGGQMCTFGFKPHDGVWPEAKNTVSADVKSGFPKDYDKSKKSPRP